MHAKSNREADAHVRVAIDLAKQKLGSAKQIRPEHFQALSYVELVALREIDPARYDALAAGIDPDAAWTPAVGGNQ